MAFLEDGGKIFSKDLPVQFVGEEGVVINCHGGLKTLSEERIVVCLGKKAMAICGSNLKVVYATPYEIYVAGKVRGVEFCE